jgi:Zn-finger nucleic acid-binding protein
MNCPVCNVALKMSDRQGVEIDYCPKCRGVWLDRGELDKIIERSAGERVDTRDQGQRENYQERYDDDDDDDRYSRGQQGRRRRGFLGDIFDFD